MSVELMLNNHLDEIDYVSLCHNLHVSVVVVDEQDKVVVGMSFYTGRELEKRKETKKMKPGRKRCAIIYIK